MACVLPGPPATPMARGTRLQLLQLDADDPFVEGRAHRLTVGAEEAQADVADAAGGADGGQLRRREDVAAAGQEAGWLLAPDAHESDGQRVEQRDGATHERILQQDVPGCLGADAAGCREEGAFAVEEMGHASDQVRGMALRGRVAATTQDLHDLGVADAHHGVHGLDHGQQRGAPG